MPLKEKLLKVMTECAKIGKDGYNNTLKYNYVTAAKVNDIVNVQAVTCGKDAINHRFHVLVHHRASCGTGWTINIIK